MGMQGNFAPEMWNEEPLKLIKVPLKTVKISPMVVMHINVHCGHTICIKWSLKSSASPPKKKKNNFPPSAGMYEN